MSVILKKSKEISKRFFFLMNCISKEIKRDLHYKRDSFRGLVGNVKSSAMCVFLGNAPMFLGCYVKFTLFIFYSSYIALLRKEEPFPPPHLSVLFSLEIHCSA
ncbi:uncharacterized protein A4U43_UnF7850 [Asparagus officinalis]|uniref:Uncharacterized protein n=1 Tax=Asparagus officinalis TaxID=4686 RepID=A0A1R3L630_ASPOF|nr:uncharacterized protein A4U43_UnF7850 [Asparagus officinalis]